MLYELVMLPQGAAAYNAANPAAAAAAGGPTSAGGVGGQNSAATAAAAAALLAGSPTGAALAAYTGGGGGGGGYANPGALTGVPLNKGLQIFPAGLGQSGTGGSGKIDTTCHHHIFVGDLAPDVESHQLKEAFSVFGVVTECKIIKDMHTQKPKGYGFVAFANKNEAEDAMQKMNGQLLGNRAIRTNWAVRKPQQTPVDQKPLNYDEVAQASSTANSTVYVGGITRGLCEELLREAFKEFGAIMEVRVFKEKGYAFIRFDTHEGATRAIITMHGKEVGGQPCKCSWGKESNEKDGAATLLTPYSYYAAAAAAAAAAANPLAYPGYASQLAFLQQQPLNPYATAAAYPTASGAMLNGYATVSSSQLVSQAYGTPTGLPGAYQHAH